MSRIVIPRARPEPASIGHVNLAELTSGIGDVSQLLGRRLEEAARPSPSAFYSWEHRAPLKSLEEKLFDALASFKVRIATVAMHLDRDWRNRLFRQLDGLLAAEDWEHDDIPPTLASFSTFLRMVLLLRPERRPGLGATSDGHLIASWTVEPDHLTIECLPQDIARWHLSAIIAGERERAAAVTPLVRLPVVLQPYDPKRWFLRASHLSA